MSVLSVVFVSERESHRMGYCTAKAFAGPQRQGELICKKEENDLIKLHPFPSKYRDFFFLGSNCFFKGIFLGTHLESYLFLLHDKRSSCPPIPLLPHIIIYLIPPPSPNCKDRPLDSS